MTKPKPEPAKPDAEDRVALALRQLKRRQRRKRLVRALILLLFLLAGGVVYAWGDKNRVRCTPASVSTWFPVPPMPG